LINGLSDERERWDKDARELGEKKRKLIGNVGLSTGFISYCGPFNAEFRDFIANERLIADLRKMGLPFESTIYQDLTNFLVDDATVSEWNLQGLPKDSLSIQNGIMVSESERFPMLIDPQGQGTFWIKNKYAEIRVVNRNNEKKFRDGLIPSTIRTSPFSIVAFKPSLNFFSLLRFTTLISAYLFLIQNVPWPCGSINIGNLSDSLTIIPF
jgi:dynein heavy chain